MARGWESKDVESRQEGYAAERGRAHDALPPDPTKHKRDHLLLERTRLLHELQLACNPRFRSQLEAALAFLDAEIQKLDPRADC